MLGHASPWITMHSVGVFVFCYLMRGLDSRRGGAPDEPTRPPVAGGLGAREPVDRIRGGAPDEPTRSPVAGGPGARQPRSSYA